MKENEQKNIAFSLVAIKTEQFAVFEDNYQPNNEVSIHSELQFKGNTQVKRLGVFLTFTYHSDGKTIIHLQTSCHFQIAEESWNSCVSGNTVSLPLDFTKQLAAIAIGTSRGILHERMQGSSLTHFLLPILDASQLAVTQVVFELD